MKPLHALVLASALAGILGCPTRKKYDRIPVVRITSPAPDTHASGNVQIMATVDPAVELPIVLRVDDTALTTLTGPSVTFPWNTIGVTEAPHTLIAEVAFSDGVAASAPVIVTVDRTRPRVVLTPTPGASGVILRSPIRAEFSEPVLLPQGIGQTFSLSVEDTPVPTTVTLDAQNRAATIRIDDPTSFTLPATLSATIAPTITDRAGNALDLGDPDWSWRVPEWIAFPAVPETSSPRIAVRSDLIPTAAWISVGRVHVATLELGDWAPFPAPPNQASSYETALTLIGEDRPFIAWSENVPAGMGNEIRAATWDGTAWNALPAFVPKKSGPSFQAPLLRTDGAGRAIVMWKEIQSGTSSFARSNGVTWEEPFQTLSIGANAAFDMVLDKNGNPVVCWTEAGMGHISTWTGTAWKAAPDPTGVFEPFLALDSADAPMVLNGGTSWFVDHLVDGSWEHLSSMAVTSMYSRHARLAAGSDHAPVVAWIDNPVSFAWVFQRWTGTQWDPRLWSVLPAAAVLDEVPQVVVDRQGSAWIGWRSSPNQSFNLWMSNY
jgi:hypothetical protein